MFRIKCIVAYDGSNYQGFQKQKNYCTIQEQLETVLAKITKDSIIVHASGRTDAHVHALGQVFHFDTHLDISENSWKKAINGLLPFDIHIKSVEIVSNEFHSRFHAHSKHYRYLINLGEYNPFKEKYELQLNSKIEISLFENVKSIFIGTHDFRNFCSNKEYEVKNFVRTIYSIKVMKQDDIIQIDFFGNGFMRYMIRMLVGTMLAVARQKITMEEVKSMLDTTLVKPTKYNASPNGLYLVEVFYENEVQK